MLRGGRGWGNGCRGLCLFWGSLHSDQVGQLQCSMWTKVEDTVETLREGSEVTWFFLFVSSRRNTVAKVHFFINVRLRTGFRGGVGAAVVERC